MWMVLGSPGAIPLPSAGRGRELNQEIETCRLESEIRQRHFMLIVVSGLIISEVSQGTLSARIYLALGMNYF